MQKKLVMVSTNMHTCSGILLVKDKYNKQYDYICGLNMYLKHIVDDKSITSELH